MSADDDLPPLEPAAAGQQQEQEEEGPTNRKARRRQQQQQQQQQNPGERNPGDSQRSSESAGSRRAAARRRGGGGGGESLAALRQRVAAERASSASSASSSSASSSSVPGSPPPGEAAEKGGATKGGGAKKEAAAAAAAAACADPGCSDSHRPSGPPADAGTAIKKLGMLFAAIAGSVMGLPFLIALLGKFVVGKEPLIYGLWVGYLAFGAWIVLRLHAKTTTWNHVFEQVTIWALVTFGSYTMIDIPKFTQGAFMVMREKFSGDPDAPGAPSNESINEEFKRVQQVVLLLWCTISFGANLAYMWWDNYDYATEERREEKKEKKREQKATLKEQKRADKKKAKAQQEGKAMSPSTRRKMDLLVYAVAGSLFAWVLYSGVNKFLEFQALHELRTMENNVGGSAD